MELLRVLQGAQRLISSDFVRALQIEVVESELSSETASGAEEKRKLLEGLCQMGYHVFALSAHVGGSWYSDFYEENLSERAECTDLLNRRKEASGVFRGGTADSSNYQYGQGLLGTIEAISVLPSGPDAAFACYVQYVATRDEALSEALRTGNLKAA
eukprot:gnl/TRDRNA2_/TRDRNA2_172263_c0_seq4.p1 gnl/TRDRNA2_/TRDRNA2_172263_c0~~gnl/TRDRNA2_/TRDRNA2_172263_c0_seq4.p1  ORF type:complete len:157 (+),score=30.49 gnl/TRDRNA2_/TRDRNA2_172263_c0_seq4:293-763(+)